MYMHIIHYVLYMYLIQSVLITCLTPVCVPVSNSLSTHSVCVHVSISLSACYLCNTCVCTFPYTTYYLCVYMYLIQSVHDMLSVCVHMYTCIYIINSLHITCVCVHVSNYNSLITQYLCGTWIITSCCSQPEVFLINLTTYR